MDGKDAVRRTTPTIAAVLLAGCTPGQPADVRACEAHITRDLAAPSSYRQVRVTRRDTGPMEAAAFVHAAGLVRPRKDDPDRELWDLEQSLYRDRQAALRIVAIRYEADDRRGEASCAFRLIDGRLEDTERLMRRATETSTDEGMAVVASLRGEARRPAPRYSCCL